MKEENKFEDELNNIFKNSGIGGEPVEGKSFEKEKPQDDLGRLLNLICNPFSPLRLTSIAILWSRIIKEKGITPETVITYVGYLIARIIGGNNLESMHLAKVLTTLVFHFRKMGFQVSIKDIVYNMSTVPPEFEKKQIEEDLKDMDLKPLLDEFSKAIDELKAIDLLNNLTNKKKNK